MRNVLIKYHKLYISLSLLLFEMAVTASAIFRLQNCNCVVPFVEGDAPFWYIYDNFLANNIFAYISIALGVVILFISSRNYVKRYPICVILLFVQMFTFIYSKQYNLDVIDMLPYLTDFYGFAIEALIVALLYKACKYNLTTNQTNKAWHFLCPIFLVAISVGIFYLFNR